MATILGLLWLLYSLVKYGDNMATQVNGWGNMSVITLAGIVAALSTIIGAVILIDSRYVHVDIFIQYDQKQQSQYEQLRIQQNKLIFIYRKQILEDKLFELDLKDHLSKYEDAIKDRYTRELNEINQRSSNLK